MNALTASEPTTDPDTITLPRRRRRRFGGPWTLGLFAVLLLAVGFLAGVRVEKGQVTSPVAASSLRSGTAGGRAALAGGFARSFGAGAGRGAAGSGSFGTVSTVSGNTVYLTDLTGNTVKVVLNSATKITKSQAASRAALHPGDSLVVRGIKAADGSISAATVSDNGASATGSTTGGGAPTSAGAAVNSLFGSASGR